MQKLEFNEDFPLSGKVLFDMIVGKATNDLEKYINSPEVTGLGITGMRMPAYEIVGESSTQVFKLLNNYIKEIGEPYVDDYVETSTEIPKFNPK